MAFGLENHAGRCVCGHLPVFSVCGSNYLSHELSHGFRRLLLHLVGDMTVYVQRERCRVVSQHGGKRFGVHAILQHHRGEGMPQVVEPHIRVNACPFQQLFVDIGISFIFILTSSFRTLISKQ